MIKIRAHHLLCIPRFYHGGYDATFAKNMKSLVQNIRKNPTQRVKIVIGKNDDLCDSCPYWYENRCVQSKQIGKWVVQQDNKVAKYLSINPNSIHKAKDVFNLSMDKVNPKTIKSVCKNCIFLKNCIKIGINNSFRKELNKSWSHQESDLDLLGVNEAS